MLPADSKVPDAVVLEDVDCPLGCPRDDITVLHAGDRLLGLPGRFAVVRCRNCGLERTNPRPDRRSIGFYYPPQYAPFRRSDAPRGTVLESTRRSWWKRAAWACFDFRTNDVPRVAPGRALEFGCAHGAGLARLAEQGFTCEGIEPSSEAAQAARERGFPVVCGSVEEAPPPERPYDLIVGWMALEHLHDPVLALSRFHDWSTPGGILALSVPNAGGWQRLLFGEHWYDLSMPTHLFHFSPKTLRRTLGAAGWEVERIAFQRILTDCVVSPGYVLEAAGRLPAVSRRLIAFPTWRWSAFVLYPLALPLSWLQATSRMTIWARKKSAERGDRTRTN